jgi:16S rRNA (uracil1498-N3)-methyltransferase
MPGCRILEDTLTLSIVTTSYYVPPENIRGDTLVLPDEEAHHAARVLRAKEGEEIVAVDGEGGWYRVQLETVERRSVTGRIVERVEEVGEPPYRLTVGMALLKNPGRYETFLEKAVEMGVARIVPLLTERTEKEHFKASRAQNILVAAMKQSGRSRLAQLDSPQRFGDVLRGTTEGMRLLCHEQTGTEHLITSILKRDRLARHITVLIGPEGGFSDTEVEQAVREEFEVVSLGPRRLRAETAALAAATAVMLTCS